MSLQIWMPLNGTLENQGLSSAVSSSDTPTYIDNGKIGKALSSSAVIYSDQTTKLFSTNSEMSLAVWVKLTASSNTSGAWIIRAGSETDGLKDRGLWWKQESGLSRYVWNEGDNGSRISPNGDDSNAKDFDNWHHIAASIQRNGTTATIKTYIDGVYIRTNTRTIGTAYTDSTKIWINGAVAYLNDLRIYDHCLSAKEVAELAKGLVLHYRLAGPGQENLALNSHYGSCTHTTTQNWWERLPFFANSTEGITKIQTGGTFTVSFDWKVTNITTACTLVLGLKYSSTSYNQISYNGTQVGTIANLSIGDSSGHAKVTFSPTSDQMQYGQGWLFSGLGSVNQNAILEVSNFKLEEGSVATPWCPNSADALYSAMGYDNNIEYDCSGYGRNGTKSGTITWDVDSPRYATSYYFPEASDISNAASIISYNVNLPTDKISYCFWFKTSHIGGGDNGGFHIPFMYSDQKYSCCYWNTALTIRWFMTLGSETSPSNKVDCDAIAYSDGKWHYIVFTYDGSNAKIYIDGILKSTKACSGTIIYDGSVLRIGVSKSQRYTNDANESDFRIYATALSAADIAELYHSAVIVDNTGKNYAYEYFEA